MEYSVARLARMAGVSARTLRYYDQIGLLRPLRVSSSGYRVYGPDQVARLQQILLYRELDMELDKIGAVLDDPKFDPYEALKAHLAQLQERKARVDALIDNVKRTIQSHEEGTEMSDEQKFEGFKKQLIDENEAKYGDEIREKYGEEAVNESNRKMMNLTKQQYDDMQQLAGELQAKLQEAVLGGESPDGEVGAQLTDMHKRWLCYSWPQYSPEAHKGLTQMYIDDERFTKHYDSQTPGCAQFLRDAVHRHAE